MNIPERVEEIVTEFNECPASKHIDAVLTTDHIRNGKEDWEGETTTDVLRRLLTTALTETDQQARVEFARRIDTIIDTSNGEYGTALSRISAVVQETLSNPPSQV